MKFQKSLNFHFCRIAKPAGSEESPVFCRYSYDVKTWEQRVFTSWPGSLRYRQTLPYPTGSVISPFKLSLLLERLARFFFQLGPTSKAVKIKCKRPTRITPNGKVIHKDIGGETIWSAMRLCTCGRDQLIRFPTGSIANPESPSEDR